MQLKVYVDNYLEGYHVPLIHPALSKVVDCRNYDVELSEWYSLQHSPLQGSDDVYGDGQAYYYQAGRLCPKHEAGVWHFHERLRAAYCA